MQRKTGRADARRRPPVASKTHAARSEVRRELRYRVIATAIAALGGTIAAIAFFAARDPLVARVAGTSHGGPALVVLLAFTTIAIIVVVHYGRRSAQLTVAYHDLHRATLQRERSEAALRESERFVRATLDAMDVMVAVLDADGVVMAVNRAWRCCADDLVGQGGACDVGTNYVALCEGVRDGRAEIAHRVAAGLREVMAGTREGFALDGRVPEDERRLLTHVTRFPGHGPLRLIVAHQHVTLEEPAHRESDHAEARQSDEAIRVPALPAKPEGAGEERFRTLAEAAPVGIFLADQGGRNTYTNPQWRGITGFVEDRGLGTWIDAIDHADRERVRGAWRDLLAGSNVFDVEFRIRTPAADVRWVHVVAKPLADDSGGAGGFVGFMLDVTRRRATEDRIHAIAKDLAGRVEARTRERDRFFTLTPDLLCVASATHLTMVNPAFTDVLGYTADELVGRSYLELVHPDDRDAARSAAQRLVAGEPVVQLESRYRHRDGSWRWIAWIAVSDPTDVVYMAGRDVTGRERARHDLARVTAEMRALYDEAPCGYCSLDAGGVLVDVNETALRWLGAERVELVGRRFADLLTDASRRRFTETSERMAAHGGVTDVELDVVRKDGTVLPVLLGITAATDAEGRVLGSRASMLDVTERRRAAERARALDDALAAHVVELEKANQELEALSRSVSRDLRAPLREIDGLASMLHEERGEQLGDVGKRHLGIIRESAGHMAHVIDGLLDLSRISRRPLDRGPIDMGALAHAVVDDVRRGQTEREVAVDVGALAPAVGDPAELRQALTNLIANAFKYTGKVAHPCVDVGSVDHDGTTVYYVRDNGAGFDMRHAHKLFHVFQRLHAPEEFDGVGIGLAVVQRVVERHGGRAWAESRVGEGATFFFTLGDRAPAEAGAAPSA